MTQQTRLMKLAIALPLVYLGCGSENDSTAGGSGGSAGSSGAPSGGSSSGGAVNGGSSGASGSSGAAGVAGAAGSGGSSGAAGAPAAGGSNGFYGNVWSATSLQNWNIGSTKHQTWSYRFRAERGGTIDHFRVFFVSNHPDKTGYSSGTGGTV